MTAPSPRKIVALGIAAMVAIAIPPKANAEIPITGGRVAGDGAFFVPETGNTLLFDASARIIRLETPNGVTVNSRFSPSRGRLNPTVGVPVGGEMGILEGTLSGRAFTSEGTPLFFQGIPTTVEFSLTSFDSNRVLAGSLVSPRGDAGAPLVFLEATGVTLSASSSQSFDAITGELHVGEYAADIPSGSIDLPSDTQFATPAIDTISFDGNRLAARANTNFRLRGSGQGTVDINSSEGTISYEGSNGSTNFRVEGTLDGSPSASNTITTLRANSERASTELEVRENGFAIEGTVEGSVNFFLSGTDNSSLDGSQTVSGQSQFELNGTGKGSTEFDSQQGRLNFHSSQSQTEVQIAVNGTEINTTASGEASFNVGVGLSATGSGSASNGQVFGSNAEPVNTDFGKGFSGLRQLPGRIQTPDPETIPDRKTTPEPEIAPEPEVTPEPDTEREPEVIPEPDTEREPEVTPEPDTDPEPEVILEPDTDPEPEATPEPEVILEPDTDPEPEVIPEPEVTPQSEVIPEPDTDPEPEATPEPDTEREPETTPSSPPTPTIPSLPGGSLPTPPASEPVEVVTPPTPEPVAETPPTSESPEVVAPVTPELPSAVLVTPEPELPPESPPTAVTPAPEQPPTVVIPAPEQPPTVVIPAPEQPPTAVIPSPPEQPPTAVIPAPELPPEIAISPQNQGSANEDPLGRLIQDILAARSVDNLRPSEADFIKTIKSQITAPIGPRSRVFPGLERMR